MVTKDGVFLSDVTWVSEKEFISEFKIRKLIKLNEIHNTVFLAINNVKLHPLNQSKTLKDKRKVLMSFNFKKTLLLFVEMLLIIYLLVI